LKHENAGKCVFTKKLSLGSVVEMPVAHVEGRFVLPKGEEDACLRKLVENDQVVFRYCDEKGEYANGRYPENPNGSFYDIAGICNPGGNVFGLMPHPERACYGWQLPKRVSNFGDGMVIFESVIEHLKRGL
jgi:phosphoribosylformylglycinamidine synthase